MPDDAQAEPLNDLVGKIRDAHPGAYDDMDDATLTKRVLAKYPQYSDLAAPKLKPPNVEMQESGIAHALNPSESVAGTGETNFVAEHPEERGKLAAAAAIGAIGPIAAPFARPAAKMAINVAREHPLLSMGALEAARALPGRAGQIASKIPAWLPLLAGGKPEVEEAPSASPPPIRWNPAETEEKAISASPPPIRWGSDVPITTASPTPKADVSKALDVGLKKALGVTEPAVEVPEGHIPVKSSALKSYRYDPAAQELHVTTNTGDGAIYGEVSPQQAQAFENAKSKGQAWKAIKDNNVPVAKVIDGKRIPVKPPIELHSAEPDAKPPEGPIKITKWKTRRS